MQCLLIDLKNGFDCIGTRNVRSDLIKSNGHWPDMTINVIMRSPFNTSYLIRIITVYSMYCECITLYSAVYIQ